MTGDLGRQAADVEREELQKAFRALLTVVEGKRVLFWILEQCAIYRDAFSGDDAATNYVLGQQASGRKVLAAIDEIDPRLYPRLLLDIAEIKAMDRAAAEARNEREEYDEE